jgi:hypothetical protein
MEDALALLASTGPEYHGGLANHGPMAAEALVTLGRFDSVVPWVEGYRRRLGARPSGSRPIATDWREALGDRKRVGDWIPFFRRRLEERPWRAVVAEWVPRLAPGIIAAAFHGVIRTGHAVRSLSVEETPARRFELAEGLAYWAANHHALPETSEAAAPGRRPSQVVSEIPLVPADQQVLSGDLTSRIAPIDHFAPFGRVAGLVDVSGDASAFVSDLTETFAGVFVATVPPGSLITFIHTVTGPSAVRLLLPCLDAAGRAKVLRYAWQGAAAHYSGFGGKSLVGESARKVPGRDDLIDRAIATGDEHAIKFTEACLREHALNPKPVYLRAADHAVSLIG